MNPLYGFLKTIYLFLAGRISFDRSASGKILTSQDGEKFTVFRRVNIPSSAGEPQAFFLVRFRPLKMKPAHNVYFSLIPMMIFMGFTGFRSKYWCVDYNTGLCQGLYEWQTADDALNYSRSIAMKFMTKRSDPESVSFRIIDKNAEDFTFTVE